KGQIMHKAVNAVRKGILYISALVLVAGYPTAAMATSQEPVTTPESQSVAQSEAQSLQGQKDGPAYTYDPSTKKLNSDELQMNAETGAYEQPPQPTIIEPEVKNTAHEGSDTTSVDSPEQT